MQIDRSLLGRESEVVTREIEKGAIRQFAEALGDPNPLYRDETAAKAAGYRSVIAPPTFSSTLSATESLLRTLNLNPRAMSHGEQHFEYFKPIVAGERINVKSRVAEIGEKAGASGPMDVIVFEDEGRNEAGDLMYRAKQAFIVRRS
jgi:acyl dehydratase